MKRTRQNLLTLLLVITSLISCNKDEASIENISPLDAYLSSDAFKNSGIDPLALTLTSDRVLTKSLINGVALVIPYKSNKLKFVVASGKYELGNKIRFITHQIEYITQLSYQDLENAIKQKSYTGSIKISAKEDDYAIIDFNKKGKVEVNLNARYRDCSLNGLGECAARRINNGNWWDLAWCAVRSIECLGQEMVSCYIDDCPYE